MQPRVMSMTIPLCAGFRAQQTVSTTKLADGTADPNLRRIRFQGQLGGSPEIGSVLPA